MKSRRKKIAHQREKRENWCKIIFNLCQAKMSFSSFTFFFVPIFCGKVQLDVLQLSWNYLDESFQPKNRSENPLGQRHRGFSLISALFWLGKMPQIVEEMLKGGQPCEDRRCERRYLEEVLNEYYFQDVENTKIDHYHFSEEYNIM